MNMIDLHDALTAYEDFLDQREVDLMTDSLESLIVCHADFFELLKLKGLAPYGGDEDLLMAEWYPRFKAQGIEVLLVRQWILEDGSVYQLQLRRIFAERPQGLVIPGSSGWRLNGSDLIESTAEFVGALNVVLNVAPEATRLSLEKM